MAGSAASAVRVSYAAGVSAEHWDGGFCGGAAFVGRAQSGGGLGTGAADYVLDVWGGALLVRESVVQRTASFGDGAGGHRTTSRLERHNRGLRRREKLGTVWTEHSLLALLPEQGLIN